MSAIVDFLASMGDILISLVTHVVTFFQSVYWVITNIGPLASSITMIFPYTPAFIYPFLQVSICAILLFALLKLL